MALMWGYVTQLPIEMGAEYVVTFSKAFKGHWAMMILYASNDCDITEQSLKYESEGTIQFITKTETFLMTVVCICVCTGVH